MWLIVVGVTLGVIAMFVLIPWLVHRAIGPALQARVSSAYADEQIVLQDLKALTLGLESLGPFQARGNGALVLTQNELHFFQYMPARDVRIPRDRIKEVKTVRSHLGKSLARKLLYVAFDTDGKPDSMAWNVTDLSAWLEKLA